MSGRKPGLIACLAAAALLAASFGTGIGKVKFHKDESWWIATSYYLEAFAGVPIDTIRNDVPRPVWADTYELITQPTLARYVIGFGRLAGGYGVADLNRKWNYDAPDSVNTREGRMPEPRLLLWSRLSMTILGAGAGLLFFFLAWRLAGPVAGWAFVLLYAFNPLGLQSLRRAMGDAALVFLAAAALLATERGVRALRERGGATPKRGRSPAFWWAVAGILCGLAGAAKLNGSLAAAGVVLAAWVAAHALQAGADPLARRRTAVGAAAIVLSATAIAFVLPNPYLYPNPVWRSARMWRNRASEMRGQMASYPNSRLDGVADRAVAASRRVFSKNATVRFPGAWVFLVVLTAAGTAILAARARRSLADGRPGTEVVVLAVGGSLVIPALLSPLDWDRYYLFPVIFTNLAVAVGAAAAFDAVRRRTSSPSGERHARSPVTS